MGLFTGKRRRGEEDRALTEVTAAPFIPGLGQVRRRVPVDKALGISDVYACVRVITESAGSLPLHVYRRTDAGRRRVTAGQLAELIRRPAPAATRSTLIGAIVGHLSIHGDAFVGKYRDGDGRITQLAPLDPRSVVVTIEAGEPVYELHQPRGVTRHGPDDILHVRGPLTFDGVRGVSPITAVRDALNVADGLGGLAASFTANAAVPGGIISPKEGHRLTRENAEDAKEKFKTLLSGDRAGQVLVMTGATTWTPLSLSMVDADFIAQRKLSTAEIARIFRVPPWMVGAASGDSTTYANTESQASAFIKFTLRPLLVAIEEAITNDRDLSPGNTYCEFVLDALLRADSKTRAEIYSLALNPDTGWMTRPEVRRLENLEDE